MQVTWVRDQPENVNNGVLAAPYAQHIAFMWHLYLQFHVCNSTFVRVKMVATTVAMTSWHKMATDFGGFPAKTVNLVHVMVTNINALEADCRSGQLYSTTFGMANIVDLTRPWLRIPTASGRSCLGAAACAAARQDVESPRSGSPSWVEPLPPEPPGCQQAA